MMNNREAKNNPEPVNPKSVLSIKKTEKWYFLRLATFFETLQFGKHDCWGDEVQKE